MWNVILLIVSLKLCSDNLWGGGVLWGHKLLLEIRLHLKFSLYKTIWWKKIVLRGCTWNLHMSYHDNCITIRSKRHQNMVWFLRNTPNQSISGFAEMSYHICNGRFHIHTGTSGGRRWTTYGKEDFLQCRRCSRNAVHITFTLIQDYPRVYGNMLDGMTGRFINIKYTEAFNKKKQEYEQLSLFKESNIFERRDVI